MDDPDVCWTWPYWKFGLKKDDLFGTLNDQYNTVPSPILDPAAFHHDVYEISQQASSTDEFHRLLNARKEQRLRELNDTLESAAFEIIANPSLIGTEQWQHAVQLFRTKSLDSLVRYFASYLPSDHPWYKSADFSSHSEADSLADSDESLEDEEIPFMDEPFEYPSYPKQLLPASPRSMTMCSDSSVASPMDDAHHEFDFEHSGPARALSFSESEPYCCAISGSDACRNCDSDVGYEPSSSTVATTAAHGVDDKSPNTTLSTEPRKGEVTLPATTPDTTDAETPTPKPEAQAASFFADTKPSPTHQRRHRSLSPSRPHPLSPHDLDQVLTAHRDPRNPHHSRLSRRERERECSPVVQRRRRGSPVESITRIHKPVADTGRSRPRGRKWADGG